MDVLIKALDIVKRQEHNTKLFIIGDGPERENLTCCNPSSVLKFSLRAEPRERMRIFIILQGNLRNLQELF